MADLTAIDNGISIDGNFDIPSEAFNSAAYSDRLCVLKLNSGVSINISYANTSINGVKATKEDIQDFIRENFPDGGGSTGEGVQSVNNISPDEDGNITISAADLPDIGALALKNTVGEADIASNSITGAKIVNGTITNNDIAANADISLGKIANVSAGTDGLEEGSIQSTFQALSTRINNSGDGTIEGSVSPLDYENSTKTISISVPSEAPDGKFMQVVVGPGGIGWIAGWSDYALPLTLGTAGQVLAVNSTGDGVEWVTPA